MVRVTVGRRLAALSLTGVVVAAVLGTVSLVEIGKVHTADQTLSTMEESTQHLVEVDRSLADIVSLARAALLAGTDADRADVTTHVAEARKMIEETLADTGKVLPGSYRTETDALTQRTSAWVEAVAGQLPTLLKTDPASPVGAAMVKKITADLDPVESAAMGLEEELQKGAITKPIRGMVDALQRVRDKDL